MRRDGGGRAGWGRSGGRGPRAGAGPAPTGRDDPLGHAPEPAELVHDRGGARAHARGVPAADRRPRGPGHARGVAPRHAPRAATAAPRGRRDAHRRRGAPAHARARDAARGHPGGRGPSSACPTASTTSASRATLYERTPPAHTGAAGGLFQTFRYLGAILATALIGAVFGKRASTEGLHALALVSVAIGAVLVLATARRGRPSRTA